MERNTFYPSPEQSHSPAQVKKDALLALGGQGLALVPNYRIGNGAEMIAVSLSEYGRRNLTGV